MDRTVHRAADKTPSLRRRARRVRRWPAALGAAALVATGLVTVTTSPAPVGAATSPIEVLGELQRPPDLSPIGRSGSIVGIDEAKRRMYMTYSSPRRVASDAASSDGMLAIYDLEPTVPKLVSTQKLFTGNGSRAPTAYMGSLAASRQRLFAIIPGANAFVDTAVLSIDLTGNTTPATWRFAERVPGLFAMGLTYSAEDDRIYVVGEIGTYPSTLGFSTNRKAAPAVTAIAALDPDDGALLWVRELPECHAPLLTFNVGSLIARSGPASAPALVVPCTTGAHSGSLQFAGQSGVVVLRIDPSATPAAARQFELDFFPISGTYANGATYGIAAYDRVNDRLFLQSMSSSTPGAWVFDLRLPAWVGFVTAPSNSPFFGGTHPTLGHYYMGGSYADSEHGFLVVTDSGATPPHNGVRLGPEYAPVDFITADPATDRFFLRLNTPDTLGRFVVVRDLLPKGLPQPLPDHDSQTADIQETEHTFVEFTGSAQGFGSRATLIGGANAATRSYGPDELKLNQLPPVVRSGTRGTALAWSPGSSVQASGSAATAQAGAVDETTRTELRNDPNLPDWEHDMESCLDGGEGATNPPEETTRGYAGVTCSHATYESTATARYTPGSVGFATNGVSVGESRFHSRIKRTSKDGVRTESTASSKGVVVDLPGIGSVSIGEVTVEAATISHGRTGSATSTWTRRITGAVVKNAGGQVVERVDGCVTTLAHNGREAQRLGNDAACQRLVDAVKRVTQARVQLFLPLPNVAATPKGAFASVAQTDADFYHQFTVSDQGKILQRDKLTARVVPGMQLDVYNDAGERSRLILQLAGVENSSIYKVAVSQTDPVCADGGCIQGGGDSQDGSEASTGSGGDGFTTGSVTFGGQGGARDEAALGATPVGRNGTIASRGSTGGRRGGAGDVFGFVFARRSLAQGSLMMSFFLLAVGAAGSVLRRRRLLGLLTLR